MQTNLLRVLQEKQITRLGNNDPMEPDVRVIAATNRNLEAMTAAGRFREDLHYRVNVFPVTLPPLRDAEKKYLMRMLEESKGNMNEVARRMDVDRKTIYRKISEYGINVQVFKG